MLFHKFGDQLFSKGSHRKPGEQIIMLGFFLVLYGGNHIRNKFADGIVNFRLCCSLCIQNQAVFVHQFQKYICNFRVKLFPAVLTDFLPDHFRRKCISVNSAGIHGIIAVCHCGDACMNGNFDTGKPVWISISIIPFVMISGHFNNMRDKGNILQYFCTDDGMFFYQIILVICKSGGLV